MIGKWFSPIKDEIDAPTLAHLKRTSELRIACLLNLSQAGRLAGRV